MLLLVLLRIFYGSLEPRSRTRCSPMPSVDSVVFVAENLSHFSVTSCAGELREARR